MGDDRVTREDLEAELRDTFGDAAGRAGEARTPLLAAAVVVGRVRPLQPLRAGGRPLLRGDGAPARGRRQRVPEPGR